MPTGEEKFWDFKRTVIDLIPESAEGFLELEPHHMEACLQVAAMYAALHMDGIDFAAHAIGAFKEAEEILDTPPEEMDVIQAPAPLTLLDGGKEPDGTRTTC